MGADAGGDGGEKAEAQQDKAVKNGKRQADGQGAQGVGEADDGDAHDGGECNGGDPLPAKDHAADEEQEEIDRGIEDGGGHGIADQAEKWPDPGNPEGRMPRASAVDLVGNQVERRDGTAEQGAGQQVAAHGGITYAAGSKATPG